MPVILKNFSKEGSVSGIWEITENENELSEACKLTNYDVEILKNPLSKNRRKELLATRALICNLGLDIEIEYDDRRPVCNKGNISISHSGNLAGIIWHPEQKTTIDIEIVNERILRISNRAFSAEELAFAGNDLRKLTLLWNSKECVYKIYGKQGIEFKSQIKVFPFQNSNKINCEIIDNKKINNFELDYSEIKSHTFAWGIK